MLQAELNSELPGQAQGGHDVVGAVAVDAQRHLAAKHGGDRLKLEVDVDRVAAGLGLLLLEHIVPCLIEYLAKEGGGDARMWGVTGSVISLVSSPSKPTPSSLMPRWQEHR